ncbi:phosphatidylglycerophosphatase A family protein [Neisseria sp. Ec49-e6-T10]|uniref:phosphatidylglycerophosphatase A family protein n=1 Tax=Neisseria sp. Ec49-e6-T10 TaxID=3140744 RepID=UPI003EBE542F
MKINPTFSWLLKHPVCFLAFGFGMGLAPKAPGTFGTLPALPIAFVLLYWCSISPIFLALSCVLLFVLGCYICAYTSDLLGVSDYGGIVWDEIVAMLLLLCCVPLSWFWWLMAFICFRIFDALKPWPISYFDQHVHGGLGIMLDDILAVIPSIVVLYVLSLFVTI